MKKSIFGKIGAAAVVLTLVTGSLVGGTFAKYTSTATGTGTAQVAAWKIAMKEGTNPIEGKEFVFNLENTDPTVTSKQGTIAPGSKGEIKFTIDGTGSEVGYTYTVNADISGLGNVPIKFYSDVDRKTPIDFTSNKAEVANGSVELDDVKIGQTASIYWAWDSTTDETDTSLGELGEAENRRGTIVVKITASQLTTDVTP